MSNTTVSGASNDYIDLEAIYSHTAYEIAHGAEGNDTILGSERDGFYYGENGNDVIDGRGGSDVVSGGSGADTLTGGEGSDRFQFDTYNGQSDIEQAPIVTDFKIGEDALEVFGADADNLAVYFGAGDQAGAAVVINNTSGDFIAVLENVHAANLAAVTGMTFLKDVTDVTVDNGSLFDDTIYGTAGDDVIYADLGADVVYGEAGNDYINLGSDASGAYEAANGGDGDDTIVGSDMAGHYYGDNGDDVIDGRGGDDLINGGAGADTLTGGEGADNFQFFATNLQSKIYNAPVVEDFTLGEDTLQVIDLDTDKLVAYDGFDALTGDTIVVEAQTGEFLAIFKGVSASDFADATNVPQMGYGSYIQGNFEQTFAYVYEGTDGADEYSYYANGSDLVVSDFDADQDVIELYSSSFQSAADALNGAVVDGNDVILSDDYGDIVLVDTDLSELSAANFLI